MQNSPPINLRKRFVPVYHERLPSILYWARHYALALLLNLAGVYSSIFARKCRIKLAKILNLAKRIVRQNRSVVYALYNNWNVLTKTPQGTPLRLISSSIAIKQQWLPLDHWVCPLNNSSKDSGGDKKTTGWKK